MSVLDNTATMHRMVRYDARREIMECVGDLSAMELFGNQLLVAPYIHSGLLWNNRLDFPIDERLSLEKLHELYDSGGGLLARNAGIESAHQGKVLLILKIGDDPKNQKLQVGDWVWTLQENARGVSLQGGGGRKSKVLDALGLNYSEGWPCKVVYDVDIYGRLSHQDALV